MLLSGTPLWPADGIDPDRWCLFDNTDFEFRVFSEWGTFEAIDWHWRRSTTIDSVRDLGDDVFEAKTASGSTYILRLSRFAVTVTARDYCAYANKGWDLVEVQEQARNMLIAKARTSS
jgi:hypothetical protein